MLWHRVKIGIYGLYHHPSNSFLFHGDPVPILKVLFLFIHIVLIMTTIQTWSLLNAYKTMFMLKCATLYFKTKNAFSDPKSFQNASMVVLTNRCLHKTQQWIRLWTWFLHCSMLLHPEMCLSSWNVSFHQLQYIQCMYLCLPVPLLTPQGILIH